MRLFEKDWSVVSLLISKVVRKRVFKSKKKFIIDTTSSPTDIFVGVLCLVGWLSWEKK